MRSAVVLASLAAFFALAFTPPASTQDVKPAEPAPCTCSEQGKRVRPKFAELKPQLDENDEIAALEAIRVALSEVGDGATYVWHRQHGRLSGLVQPTASFKDPAGRVCRHIILVMSSGIHSGKIEGVACRLGDGRWQLEG
jgi:hypothetical protein